MGIFSRSKSSTTNISDDRDQSDNSVVDFGIGGNNKYFGGTDLSDLNVDGNLTVSTTDFGAIEGAISIAGSSLAAVDRSVDTLGNGFNSAISSLNKMSVASIDAVKQSYQSDNKSISQTAIMWGSFVALGYLSLKLIKG